MLRRPRVMIVGAGPSGLSLSALLTRMGVANIVLERSPVLPTHPQAHYVNARTMEIFRNDLGLEDACKRLAPPEDTWQDFTWCTQLRGGRELARVRNISVGTPEDPAIRSPCRSLHLSQSKLLPLLLGAAKEEVRSTKSEVIFGGSYSSFSESEGGVTVTVSDERGGEREVTVDFLVGADGANSRVRRDLNIGMVGRSSLASLMNIHVRVDPAVLSPSAMLSFVFNPSAVAVMVAHGDGEWVCQMPFSPDLESPAAFTPAACTALVSACLGVREADVTFVSAAPWTMHAQVASRYSSRHGRVLLVGDSAHRFPPAGGFGMNTGIQDAHHLACSIAGHLNAVTAASPVPALGSMGCAAAARVGRRYEAERRPVAVSNTVLSVKNFDRVLALARALGVDSRQLEAAAPVLAPFVDALPRGAREKAVGAALGLARSSLRCLAAEGHPVGEARAAQLQRLIRTKGLPLHFPVHELAFSYAPRPPAAAASTAHPGAYPGTIIAGTRAPHCRLGLTTAACTGLTHKVLALFTPTDLPAQLHRAGLTSERALVLIVPGGSGNCTVVPCVGPTSLVVVTVRSQPMAQPSSVENGPFPAHPWGDTRMSAGWHAQRSGRLDIECIDIAGDWAAATSSRAALIRPDGHLAWVGGWGPRAARHFRELLQAAAHAVIPEEARPEDWEKFSESFSS